MTPYARGARRLGAGGALTVLQFAPLARLRPVLGFNVHFGACSWFMHTEVRFGEPVSESLKEENGGGLTSSSFGRLRCRKSPARGFWTCWIHWCCFQGHLKTSSASFSPLKFQQAPGSLKPSLIEDMVW
jgi:hypothetical protein